MRLGTETAHLCDELIELKLSGDTMTAQLQNIPNFLSTRQIAQVALLAIINAGSVLAAGNCDVTDIGSLKRCVADNQIDQISLRQDLICNSASECCGPNNSATIVLNNVTGRSINGNGHTIHRGTSTHSCGAITVNHSSDIVVENLLLDEGDGVPACELSEKDCPNSIAVNMSKNVHLDNIHIRFGKGFVVKVWGVDGFDFTRSSLSDSGQIGLSIGNYKYAASKNIRITDNKFERTRTNAIALSGASDVLIAHNTFVGNHWHGLWRPPRLAGGIVGGGTIRIGDATNVRVTGNTVLGAYCGNCNPPHQPVLALELGDEDPAAPGVSDLMINDNDFSADIAIYQNVGSTVAGVQVENNRLRNKTRLDTLAVPATRSGNLSVK